MTPVYEAGSQLLKVRFVMWMLVLVGLAAIYYGVHLGLTYGTRPADGGVLAPLSVRLAWALGLGLCGLAVALSMMLYGRRFIARIVFDATTGRYHVHTLGLVGSRRRLFAAAEIQRGGYYHGRMRARVSVAAPWWSVRLGSNRVPFLIDAQGTIFDESRFRVFTTRGANGQGISGFHRAR